MKPMIRLLLAGLLLFGPNYSFGARIEGGGGGGGVAGSVRWNDIISPDGDQLLNHGTRNSTWNNVINWNYQGFQSVAFGDGVAVSIDDELNVSSNVIAVGNIEGASGVFSGNVSGTNGQFSNQVSGITGSFTGLVSASSVTATNRITGDDGVFNSLNISGNSSFGTISGTTLDFSSGTITQLYVSTITANSPLYFIGDQIRAPPGSNSAPMYSFSGDNDTGIYSSAVNTLGFATNGSLAWYVNPSGTLFANGTSRLAIAGGTASAPSLTFGSDTNTGIYRAGEDALRISANGNDIVGLTTTLFFSNQIIGINPEGTNSAPALYLGADIDTGIYHPANNSLGITTAGTLALNIQGGQQVQFTDGSVSAPSISFLNDIDTGIYLIGSNDLGLAVSGTLFMELTNISANPSVLFTNGLVGSPSISFIGDTNTGIYWVNTDNMGFVAGGVDVFNIGPSRLQLALPIYAPNGSTGAPSYTFSSDIDTGIFTGGSGRIDLSSNGTNTVTFDSTSMTATILTRVADGAVGTPAYSFINDTDSGIYLDGTGAVRVAIGGNIGLSIASTANTFYAGGENQFQVIDGLLNTQNGSVIRSADGSLGTPGYNFSGDVDAGMWLVTAGELGFQTNSINRLSVSNSNITATVPILTTNGTVGAPSYSFTNDPNTGIYRRLTDSIGIACGGVLIGDWNNVANAGLRLNLGLSLLGGSILNTNGSASAPAYSFTNDTNTGFWNDGGDKIGFSVGGTNRLYLTTGNFYPATDNAYSLGIASFRWSDVRSVLINGADYGFANGWIMREYPCTYDDVQTKSPDWMKENADKGIQILNKEGDVVMVIGKSGTLYVKDIQKVTSFTGLEE